MRNAVLLCRELCRTARRSEQVEDKVYNKGPAGPPGIALRHNKMLPKQKGCFHSGAVGCAINMLPKFREDFVTLFLYEAVQLERIGVCEQFR